MLRKIMSEYYDYGPAKRLVDRSKYEADLHFILYHLIFNTNKTLDSYKGHSAEDWERYKRTTSPDLVEIIHKVLDWAFERPDYDFNDLIRPARGPVENKKLYKYICDFRHSIETYRPK